MKTCNKCKVEKEDNDFYSKKRFKVRKDGTTHSWTGLYSSCKLCTGVKNKEARGKYQDYYKQYREDNKEAKREYGKSHYIKNKIGWVELITSEVDLVCSSCGYDKTLAGLDFHHKDPREKESTIHKLMKNTPNEDSWLLMKEELNKCVVLCATCHREEHMKYDILALAKEKATEAYRRKG